MLKDYCDMGGNKSCTPLNVFEATVDKVMSKRDSVTPTQLLDWWRDWGAEFNVNMVGETTLETSVVFSPSPLPG